MFRAGAAVRIITPDPLLPVSGGIGTPVKAAEKKGDLYVRALVFEKNNEKIAIVSIDNLGWPAPLGDMTRALVKSISPENIMIGATHTHSGPDAYGFPDQSGVNHANREYLDWCTKEMAIAIEDAVAALEPASLRIAVGEAKGKIAYNYYAEQLYDPSCGVIQAVSTKGNVIATLVNYAIHPEVIGAKRGILSPDLCGPLYTRIEEKTGGIAIFMNGAQGGMITADNRQGNNKEANTWEECIRIGNLLADEALRIIKDSPLIDNPEIKVASRKVTFPVDSPVMRHIMKKSALQYPSKKEHTVTTQLNLLQVAQARILTIPGEALPNIGYYLKRKMGTSAPFLFGLTNDAFGYILTKEDFNSFKRYEYISKTSLGELTGEILVDHAIQMLQDF